MIGLTAVRFNMKADILRQGVSPTDPDPTPTGDDGDWVMQQDPDSGEIIRVWQPNVQDDPDTPDTNEATTGLESFDCIARGIVDGGIRVAGTTERFGDLYENVDYVSMTVGPDVNITKRDKVTNIRNRDGIILWRNEEQSDSPPTVFSVMGVTPIPDPWGRYIEQRVMLERAEIQ